MALALFNYWDQPRFRNGLFRYIGYAAVVGESSKNILDDTGVKVTYAITGVYMLLDLVLGTQGKSGALSIIFSIVDSLLWQGAASVVLFWICFKFIITAVEVILDKLNIDLGSLKQWIPIIIALAFVPLLGPRIDNITTLLMNMSYRVVFK